MTDDDYKELMKFHLLFCVENINQYTHAAVDYDGALWVYVGIPICDKISGVWDNNTTSDADKIKTLTLPPNWKETLIEL